MKQEKDPNRSQKLERLKQLRLLDDSLFTKCLDDNAKSMELILGIILNDPSIKVSEVRTQKHIEEIQNRSVRLDIFAKNTENGTVYDVEIQRTNAGASPRRARHNSAALDKELIDKGESIQNLPDSYVIFLTEKDIYRHGLAVYHVRRYIEELSVPFNDGAEIIYENGSYSDETDIGKLMHDFRTSDPDKMYFSILAESVRYFKEQPEGVDLMCEVMEKFYNEGYTKGEEKGEARGEARGKVKGTASTVKKLLNSNKISFDDLTEALEITPEELNQLIKEN